jgi:PIN domain nuclease of toxin-antitoxin system
LKLLLDTQAAIWWLSDDRRLGDAAADQLRDDSNHVLLSAVVVWEAAIKRAIGKLDTPGDLAATLLAAGVLPLPITLEHAAGVEHLPHHHGDPFDRLLIAQATIENATLVSGDSTLRAYDVPVLW